jgi:hypothetical protein
VWQYDARIPASRRGDSIHSGRQDEVGGVLPRQPMHPLIRTSGERHSRPACRRGPAWTGPNGAEVSSAELLGIFALGRLLTAAPITPGGLGVVGLTYITGLVLAGGYQIRAQAVAAARLFRLFTYGLQIPLGGITHLIWQRRTSWRKPVREQEPAPGLSGPEIARIDQSRRPRCPSDRPPVDSEHCSRYSKQCCSEANVVHLSRISRVAGPPVRPEA